MAGTSFRPAIYHAEQADASTILGKAIDVTPPDDHTTVMWDATAGKYLHKYLTRNSVIFNFQAYFDGVNTLNNIIKEYPVPFDGWPTAVGVRTTDVRTAGSFLIKVTNNETPIVNTALDLSINGSYTLDNTVVLDPATISNDFLFTAGEKLGVKLTMDGSYEPLLGNAYIYVIFTSNL